MRDLFSQDQLHQARLAAAAFVVHHRDDPRLVEVAVIHLFQRQLQHSADGPQVLLVGVGAAGLHLLDDVHVHPAALGQVPLGDVQLDALGPDGLIVQSCHLLPLSAQDIGLRL